MSLYLVRLMQAARNQLVEAGGGARWTANPNHAREVAALGDIVELIEHALVSSTLRRVRVEQSANGAWNRPKRHWKVIDHRYADAVRVYVFPDHGIAMTEARRLATFGVVDPTHLVGAQTGGHA